MDASAAARLTEVKRGLGATAQQPAIRRGTVAINEKGKLGLVTGQDAGSGEFYGVPLSADPIKMGKPQRRWVSRKPHAICQAYELYELLASAAHPEHGAGRSPKRLLAARKQSVPDRTAPCG